MKINLVFDSSQSSAAPGVIQDIENAAALLDTLIANPITVTIKVGIGEIGGTPLAAGASGEGEPTSIAFYSYSQVQAALAAQANSPLAQQIVAALPAQSATDPKGIGLSPAEAYALGLASPAAGAVDGEVGFLASLPAQASLSLYLHELTHALGRVRSDSLMSLYVYSAPGSLVPVQNSGYGEASYFSIDGGKTNLGTFDTVYDASDWANPGPDPTAARFSLSYIDGPSDIDLMTALGFQLSPAPVLTAATLFQGWAAGKAVSYTLPVGTFYSAQAATYTATLSDGSALPAWLSFNGATQTFTGTAPAGYSEMAITVKASNALGTALDSFDAGQPMAAAVNSPTAYWAAGAPFSLALASLFTGPVETGTAYRLLLVNKSTGSESSTLPSWMTLNAATETLSGTLPAPGNNYSLLVDATNPDGDVAAAVVSIYPTTSPISAHAVAAQSALRGQAFSFTLPPGTFTDTADAIAGSTMLVQDLSVPNTPLAAAPSWLSYNAATMTLSGTAPTSGSGSYAIAVTAADSNGALATVVFDLALVTPLTVSAALAASQAGTLSGANAIYDTAASVDANLDALEPLVAANKLSGITLTDTGTPTLSVTASQLSADKAALGEISGSFLLSIAAPAGSTSITGLAGHANIVHFSGTASQYSLTPSGNGTSFTVSGAGATDTLGNVQSIQFSDFTDIVASQTPPAPGAVSSAQVT